MVNAEREEMLRTTCFQAQVLESCIRTSRYITNGKVTLSGPHESEMMMCFQSRGTVGEGHTCTAGNTKRIQED
jgi:hypothetical protein